MVRLTLKRTLQNEHKTLGLLRVLANEQIIESRIKTLELPWRGNQRNISCIPASVYECEPIIRPNGDWAISILNVPNRSNILIHKGNFTTDIQGCILVGLAHVDINEDGITDVQYSRQAMAILQSLITEPTTIEIQDYFLPFYKTKTV